MIAYEKHLPVGSHFDFQESQDKTRQVAWKALEAKGNSEAETKQASGSHFRYLFFTVAAGFVMSLLSLLLFFLVLNSL